MNWACENLGPLTTACNEPARNCKTKTVMTKQNLIQVCLLSAALLQAATSGAQPVTKIAGGGSQSFFLKSGGSLWAMGLNDFGQLGNGTYNPTNWPEKILVTNVTAIAAGIHHTLFLKNDGSLWAMGDNESGELGDGTINQANQPAKIVATNVTAIAGGEFHSLFLKSDGSLWAMGYNSDGELGDTTFNDSHSPEKIVTTNVTAIAAGEWHSLFLKSDGSLWAMGWNEFGQLGDGNNNRPDVNSPEKIVTTNVTAIAAGWDHSLFLKDDGSLWAMGNNAFGQLGDGSLNSVGTNSPEKIVASGVTAIAAGRGHSLFLKSDGSLWAMGDNGDGQLGDGTVDGQLFPEKIVASGVTAIAAGEYHSVFLKSDGSFWGMGHNDNGELGDRTLNNTNRTELILAAYDRIFPQLLSGSGIRLSFVGIDRTSYALDRSFKLAPANWVPQTTNSTDSVGVLVLTNTPNPATNNFWRMRSVP
jgi:alpha-tubulin suppressor-like RCC1 family protein